MHQRSTTCLNLIWFFFAYKHVSVFVFLTLYTFILFNLGRKSVLISNLKSASIKFLTCSLLISIRIQVSFLLILNFNQSNVHNPPGSNSSLCFLDDHSYNTMTHVTPIFKTFKIFLVPLHFFFFKLINLFIL